jgi:hypothetical protein
MGCVPFALLRGRRRSGASRSRLGGRAAGRLIDGTSTMSGERDRLVGGGKASVQDGFQRRRARVIDLGPPR